MFTIDEKTLKNLKELLKFVDFVLNIEYLEATHRETAEEIKYLINNINNPTTHKQWNVTLQILDYELQHNREKQGVYCRNWFVSFEKNHLEIEAASYHSEDALGYYEDDYCYFASVFFKEGSTETDIYMDCAVNDFIKDAMNYKKYIVGNLKEIDIDIDVW